MVQPEATKRALLDAGRAEFAQHGLAGARTDRIAAASGVNKQRIYAYFGNKDGLFQAVLADALGSLLEVVPLPDPELPRADFLATYVEAVSKYHRTHPDLLRLLQWEALELGASQSAPDDRTAHYAAKVTDFAAALDITPESAAPLLFGIIGLAAWPHMVPQLGALILGPTGTALPEPAIAWAAQAAGALAP